jgi:XTP/dITP diphosphohydrolase
MNIRLLIGTHNLGKAAEISILLAGLKIEFLTLRDVHETHPVLECGQTYEENAILKAEGYARQTGLLTVADDSGLEVEALKGAPGVLSARYAGAGRSDRERIEFLLSQLAACGSLERTARFVSVVAVADPGKGVMQTSRGICEGTIIETPRGTNGFGYDPIFIPNGYDFTFGELSSTIKDEISHRGKALQSLRPFLAQLVSST